MTTYYADDLDVRLDTTVRDSTGGTLAWNPVEVTAGATTITAAWQGSTVTALGVSTRVLRIPLTSLGVGKFHLRLKIPGAPDFDLGTVTLQ